MKKPEFIRKKNVLMTLDENGKVKSSEDFASNNLCKKKSRELQVAAGGLGCGIVKVIR